MQSLKKIPLFLVLIAVFFCAHGAAENFGSLTVKDVLLAGISLLLFIVLLLGIILLITRKLVFAALISIFICIWFFFFGAIHDFIKSYGIFRLIKSYSVLVPLLLIATLLWIWFLKRKKHLWPGLVMFLNILFIIYCMIDLGRLGYKAATSLKPIHNLPFDAAAASRKPDVFFILCDGYPGPKSLADSFHFSNAGMLDFLSADSFRVLNTRSNYNITHFSMASLLNMKYISEGYDHFKVNQQDIQKREQEINDAEVFADVKRMGYRVYNNSIFDINNIPGAFDANSFLLGHAHVLTDKIFTNRLNRDLGASLPRVWSKIFPFLSDWSPESQRDNTQKMSEKLLKIAGNKPGEQPLFCYTHFLLPHGPYFFDSLGNAVSPAVYSAAMAWADRGNFISYLQYTNGVVKKVVRTIRDKRPRAIIILMSDHGFREYNNDNYIFQPAHFDNFCAVHFPGGGYDPCPDSLTNVNVFRYIFNAQFGQKLPYLKDSLFNVVFTTGGSAD